MNRLRRSQRVHVELVRQRRVDLRYPMSVLCDDGDRVDVTGPFAEVSARDLGYVTLAVGDVWTERYWRSRWFSVKRIDSAEGRTKGWYCDVCRPAVVSAARIRSVDLYLDVWVPDVGEAVLLDEEEFREAALPDEVAINARRAAAILLSAGRSRDPDLFTRSG